MVLYSVTIRLDKTIEQEWQEWMCRVHVPAVMATGCFVRCRMYREFATVEPTYVLQYECRSQEDYLRYRDTHAAALQAEHSQRYEGRFQGSRAVLGLCGDFAG